MAKRKGFLQRLWDAIKGETAQPTRKPPSRPVERPTPSVRPAQPSTRPSPTRQPPKVQEYVPTSSDEVERIANHLIRELRGKPRLNPNRIRKSVDGMTPDQLYFASRAKRADIEFQAGPNGQYFDDDGNNIFWYN